MRYTHTVLMICSFLLYTGEDVPISHTWNKRTKLWNPQVHSINWKYHTIAWFHAYKAAFPPSNEKHRILLSLGEIPFSHVWYINSLQSSSQQWPGPIGLGHCLVHACTKLLGEHPFSATIWLFNTFSKCASVVRSFAIPASRCLASTNTPVCANMVLSFSYFKKCMFVNTICISTDV